MIFRVLRIFRILRILRLLKGAKGLRDLLMTMVRAFPAASTPQARANPPTSPSST